MSETIDSAPPSAPLALVDSSPTLFTMRDKPSAPSTVTVPGSSRMALTLFDVVAIGTVKPSVPGNLVLTLYGMAKGDVDSGAGDPGDWLPLSSSVPEPIGGTTDLPETMWMIRGKDLMIFTGSGRLQGTFDSNVANNPQGPLDLDQHPGDITDEDPLYVFAVGAAFFPTGGAGRAAGEPSCTLTLHSLTISD